jgi:hypothetical protein
VVVFALGSVTGNAKASACNADAKTLITAVQAYNAHDAPIGIQAESTVGPGSITPGTPSTYSGAGTQAALLLSTYLNAWPASSNGYALSLSTTTPGDVMVYIPATNPIGESYDNETSTTACNRL